MRVLELIVPAFLAMPAAGLSTHVGSAQTPRLDCAQLANVVDDDAPLAVRLSAPASIKIQPSQAEAACRSALGGDPANPTIMLRRVRSLSAGNSRRHAIRYYLDAADRG